MSLTRAVSGSMSSPPITPAFRHPGEDGDELLRHVPESRPCDDEAVDIVGDGLDLLRCLARMEREEGDLRVELVVHADGSLRPWECPPRELDLAVRGHAPDRRVVHRPERVPAGRVHLAHLRATMDFRMAA